MEERRAGKRKGWERKGMGEEKLRKRLGEGRSGEERLGEKRVGRGKAGKKGMGGKGWERKIGRKKAGRQKPREMEGMKRIWLEGKWIKYAALMAALLILAVRPRDRDRVIFLDVGQGDCCLVQTASGENYLFDCGSSSRSGVGRYVLLPCLKYYGIHTIDAVFVSHPDTDHMNGVMELLESAEDNCIDIKQLILSDIENSARKEQFSELLAAADGRRVAYLAAGESWECGSAYFICLHPAKGYSAENVNAYSQCIYACFDSFSLLLTGDVEEAGERALLEALKEKKISDVTVLKVAHHGSRNSTSAELLEQISPELAVISCGKNNRYGHPHPELLERLSQTGCNILQTSEVGAVTIQRAENAVKVWGFRK